MTNTKTEKESSENSKESSANNSNRDPLYLYSSVHPGLSPISDIFEVRSGCWEELEARKYAAKKELNSLMQGTESISSYFTKMKILWDGLNSLHKFPVCSCGAAKDFLKVEEDEKLVHFLMGLNESYAAIRSAILMVSPLPTLSRAYALLLQDERLREAQGSSPDEGKNLYCTNCKKTNHNVDNCFLLIGFPSNYRDRNKKTVTKEKFAGAAQSKLTKNISELTDEQIHKLLNLVESTSGRGKQTEIDDFASFADSRDVKCKMEISLN